VWLKFREKLNEEVNQKETVRKKIQMKNLKKKYDNWMWKRGKRSETNITC
jgi:hypothetical protein